MIDREPDPRPHSVAGRVTDANGQPVRGLPVTAYDQDMRTRQTLGRALTDANGRYFVAYGVGQFSGAELASADLVVEVADADGKVLSTTPVRFNCAYDTIIDIVLPTGDVAEYDRNAGSLATLIAGQEVTLATLEEDGTTNDITFAAGESGLPRESLLDFAIAQRLGGYGDLPPQFWFALLRSGTIAETASSSPQAVGVRAEGVQAKIPFKPVADVKAGLDRALAANAIAASFQGALEGWLRLYGKLVSDAQAKPGSTPSLLGKAAELSEKAQAAFAAAYAQGGSRADILTHLVAAKVLSDAEVSATETVLALHDLVLGDVSLAAALKTEIENVTTLPRIAKLSPADWTKRMQAARIAPPDYIAGNDDAERLATYSQLLSQSMATAYPTMAFGAKLAQAADPPLKQPKSVVAFIEAHPEFELHTTSVDGFLKDKAKREFVAGPDAGVLAQDLKLAQRIVKLVPAYDAAAALLTDGIHSAGQIYRMGQSQFMARYQDRPGFSAEVAEQTWHAAANTYAAVLTLVGDLRATLHANQVQALANNPPALSGLPDWSELFGESDFCACEDCRSIFSPAAYLADLLKWLESRRLQGSSKSAKDVLFERRPDLGYIDLSCENTNTELPYIDLACEIMEDLVSPWKLTTLAAGTPFAAGPAAGVIAQAFYNANPRVTLAADAEVYGPDHFNRWIVRSASDTYLVAANRVDVTRLRQTRSPSDELMAYPDPDYVNQGAYTTVLDVKSYPNALPFDLYSESVRAYLGLAGVGRSDLMRALRANAANPNDLNIAAEYLNISLGEQPLIFQEDSDHQGTYWGEASTTDAIAEMSKVDVFLARTGLSFNQMQQLLSLGFINPGGAIVIQNLDESCNTNDMRLQVLDKKALDRIHRFLRLWRKLGWQMWELDLVIRTDGLGTNIGTTALDANLAIRLEPFLRLKDRLKTLSVEQMCAFYDKLSTTPKFTQAYKPPTPSLYEQLFLNKRTSGPIDLDFAVAAVTAPTQQMDDEHSPLIVAATRLREADLALLKALQKPGAPVPPNYIDNRLSLGNLSFLYRHAMLTRALGIKMAEWKTLLSLAQVDPFASPQATLDFVALFDRIKQSGFTIDQLDYLLAGNGAARAAVPEKTFTVTMTTLRSSLQAIAAAYDPSQIPTDLPALGDYVVGKLQLAGWDTASASAAVRVLNNTIVLKSKGPMVATITFPEGLQATYDPEKGDIYFTGVMTQAQKNSMLADALPAAVLANADYISAVNELFDLPRAMVRRYLPSYAVSLPALAPAIQFSALEPALAARLQYDPARQTLSFFGAMTRDEQAKLNGLAGADAAFKAAVEGLSQQAAGAAPPDQTWVAPADLAAPPGAAAARKLAAYLAQKLSVDQIVQQIATAFGFTQSMATNLLNRTAPRTILADLVDSAFVASSASLTKAAFPILYQDYAWLSGVALILKTVGARDDELDWLERQPATKGILDIGALPPVALDPANPPDTHSTAPVQLGQLIALAEFMAWHHRYSDGNTSLLAVVDRLVSGSSYTAAQFGNDLARSVGWLKADVEAFVGALDIGYPAGYRTIAGWRRLNDAFIQLQKLTASAAGLLKLSKSAVGPDEDALLRGMLRAQYSEADWLAVNRVIQDKLRERRRDALIACLVAKGAPANAPNAPWKDGNDLFDCYLIDVQMCSCMPTTRIVQAYAAVQAFVQRCLMELEPEARADGENDQGWSQWKWMKFYRLWEANRRVFAYPENYAEPELRKDKSELFAALENALQQNAVTSDNVETAYLAYLEGLDDIAQLEVAGTFYQEDSQTLHVFGRSAGGNPRLYYYRQFIAGRRWTPWSKVDLDVKGDYLTPFVLHGRLYAVWLEFQQKQVSTQTAPIPSGPGGSVMIPGTGGSPTKVMDVVLAISELRNGKWTHKKLADQPLATSTFIGAFDDSQFLVVPLDLTWLPSALFPNGGPAGSPLPADQQWLADGPFLILVRASDGPFKAYAMAGCRGYPEPFAGNLIVVPELTTFFNARLLRGRDESTSWATDLLPNKGTLLPATEILANLPSAFEVLYPNYLSLIDRFVFLLSMSLAVPRLIVKGPVRGPSIRVGTTLGSFYDWFYADGKHTYHVRPELLLLRERTPYFYEDLVDLFNKFKNKLKANQLPVFIEKFRRAYGNDIEYRLRFGTFYHPLVCAFISQLYTGGIEALLSRKTQFLTGSLDFMRDYLPSDIVDPHLPKETVEFDDPKGPYPNAYAQYNWELFYFAPLMIAERLSRNQQFEDAMKWYHYIFDPTGSHNLDPVTNVAVGAPQVFWNTKPFYERQSGAYLQQRLLDLMTLLSSDPNNPTPSGPIVALRNQVKDWRNDPFDPHLVAQYRTVAYQKIAVMKYLDNLIAWGDQQFTMDTMESVNIATQLYVLAAHILGRRPEIVPPPKKPVPETFNELDNALDAFSNALVSFENLVPSIPGNGGSPMPTPDMPGMLYFCIPQNDQLQKYWDTVEDRLYKIRHCLNIEGVFSPPVLFPPPINPMDLVRSAAQGIDLSTALSDLGAPLPHYRFVVMLQMANEFVADVKAMGTALLSALEKKDAEALASLRQGQEVALLKAVRAVRQKQLDDANLALEALNKNVELVTQRRDYYASREFMNAGEITAMAMSGTSLALDAAAAIAHALSGGLKGVPQITVGAAGFGGSPVADVTEGGQQIGGASEEAAKVIETISGLLQKGASIAAVVASYQRRMDDWQFQVQSATKELEQLAQQVASAEKKIEIAQTEIDNQDLQINNSQAVQDFLSNKYTNQDLYQWLVGQISQTYFQSYNLACDVAKKAEKCLRYELGLENTSYIKPGYWNSLRSGLEAGESLQLDLRRMENDYHALNRREFECVKHVSLAQVAPAELLKLKDTGLCQFDLPEELFDLDFPGHYFRRIKTVAMTIPCVAGPYASVNATLRLLKNSVRVDTTAPDGNYEHNNDDSILIDDDRFRQSNVRITAIAASGAQNDSGLFELSFRDERYLPFEGAGVISTWQIQLMSDPKLRSFSYATISDVILHIRYTAREDAGQFRDKAIAHLSEIVGGNGAPALPQWRLFDLMHEFPTEWYTLLHPPGGAAQTLKLRLGREHFGHLAQDSVIHLTSVAVLAKNGVALNVKIDPPFGATVGAPLVLPLPASGHVYSMESLKDQDIVFDETAPWMITFLNGGVLNPQDISECYLVIGYVLQNA